MKTNRTDPGNINLVRLGVSIIFIALLMIGLMGCSSNKTQTASITVKPIVTDIHVTVSVSGTVLPKNKLEVKPPLGGRVESVLVDEGQFVYKGQTIAYMSSSERAAMLDAARAQGSANLKYWEQVYKPLLIVSPMNGTVIVRNIEPGQTLSSADTAVVISDRLIVQALIDETDIGQMKFGMLAYITLDAYPDVRIKGKVGQISYESKTVNNVTMYQADIIPDKVPDFVRSGMSASMEIIVKDSGSIMTLPKEAIKSGDRGTFVLVTKVGAERPELRPIRTGTTNGSVVEILGGVSTNDNVLVIKNVVKNGKKKKSANQTTNPFMPQRPKSTRTSGSQHGGGEPPHP